jgi:hypothetical protein
VRRACECVAPRLPSRMPTLGCQLSRTPRKRAFDSASLWSRFPRERLNDLVCNRFVLDVRNVSERSGLPTVAPFVGPRLRNAGGLAEREHLVRGGAVSVPWQPFGVPVGDVVAELGGELDELIGSRFLRFRNSLVGRWLGKAALTT